MKVRLIVTFLAICSLTMLVWTGDFGEDLAAATRSIPWDCSDWQAAAAVADAEDDRVSVILESLATNRGKTLYCGVDQSDTFTKAETWEAGKDRNERDDTVYYGENGRFRGFLAAQEGWLTDGASGVTGISREWIFEFPQEKKRRRVRWKRLDIVGGLGDGRGNLPTGEPDDDEDEAKRLARQAFLDDADSLRRLREDAVGDCRDDHGYPRATNVRIEETPGEEIWRYTADLDGGADYQFRIRRAPWTATCLKRR